MKILVGYRIYKNRFITFDQASLKIRIYKSSSVIVLKASLSNEDDEILVLYTVKFNVSC